MSFLSASAQLVTDRPDQTESSSTVPKGAFQVETGILLGYDEGGSFSIRQLLLPTTLFRYGLTKGIELRVLSQFESIQMVNREFKGISDLEIGTKIQILKKENVNTEIAFLTQLLIPTGSLALTNNTFGTTNKLSLSHALNENLGFGYNVGYNYFGAGRGDLTYSMALGVGVNDKVSVYVEPYGELSNLNDFVLNADAGFTYLLKENLQLDFSFGMGLIKRMNYLSVGCSWLIE